MCGQNVFLTAKSHFFAFSIFNYYLHTSAVQFLDMISLANKNG